MTLTAGQRWRRLAAGWLVAVGGGALLLAPAAVLPEWANLVLWVVSTAWVATVLWLSGRAWG